MSTPLIRLSCLRPAWLAATLLAVALLFTAPALHAQGAESNVPGYAEQIKNALNEAALGNFAEAREHFRRAHALDPSARTLRGLGMVEFELSHYVESVRLLNQALDSEVKPLSGKLRSETESLLVRAREYIGVVRVSSEPKSAAVIVDGSLAELGPSRTITLPVGDHVFELRSDGFLPAKKVLTVEGGESTTLALKLVAVASDDEPSSQPLGGPRHDEPVASKPLAHKWWFWLTLGVVVAAGGATAAILLTREGEQIDAYTTRNSPAGSTIKTLTLGSY